MIRKKRAEGDKIKQKRKESCVMNRIVKKIKSFNGASVIASFAMFIAIGVANSCCVFIYHQPEMPESLRRLRKF